MKLQANFSGAWRTLTPFVEENSNLDALQRQWPAAPKLRVVDGADVIWYWDQDKKWHRPHFYKEKHA